MVIPTLIDRKPKTIATVRNPSTPIIVRIETFINKPHPINKGDNLTEMADILVLAPLVSDLKFGDRFYVDGRLYELLHVMPYTELSSMMQIMAIVRD